MASTSHRRLSLKAFTAWLGSKHSRTKVGEACDGDNCPLAKFLTQTTGVPYQVGECYTAAKLDRDGKVVKDLNESVVYDYQNSVDLPLWAADFVSQVDSGDGNSVSAGRALSIVRSSRLGRMFG